MSINDRINGVNGGAALKIACRMATTGPVALQGVQTIDGVVGVEDDRVLVKNNADAKQNGIWIMSSGNWVRTKDFDGPKDVQKGTMVLVVEGTVNANNLFKVTTADPVDIGTDNITFDRAGYITADDLAAIVAASEAAQTARDEAIDAKEAAEAAAALIPLNNYTAVTNPGVNDDANDGYSPGSQWLNTLTGDRFQCSVATVGAAVWIELSGLDVGDLGSMAFETKEDYFLKTDVAEIRQIPQNSKSAAYTLVLADAGKHIYHPTTDATARVWTIPKNADVAFPIGTAITFDNDYGAGALTLDIDTSDGDTMILVGTAGTSGDRTLASGGQATILKVGTKRWRISGTGLT